MKYIDDEKLTIVSWILLFLILVIGVFSSCKSINEVPIRTDTIVRTEYKEIVRYDTVKITLPQEKVETWVYPTDTLKMRTSFAFSEAWVDSTTNTLKGILESLKTPLETVVPAKDRVVYRDSIVYVENPIIKEVVKTQHPAYEKWLWLWLIVSIGGLLIWLKNKMRGSN